MKLIDSHLQTDALSLPDLELMAAAGITAVIGDATGGQYRATSASAALQFFNTILEGETRRIAEFSIDVYAFIGINMFAVPKDYEKILEALPEYLKRDRVIGVGEVGLEARSKTCPDLSQQEEILKTELKLAKEFNKAVVLHLPPGERTKWIERYLELIDEVKLERDKVVIIHCDSATIKIVTDSGCNAGISMLPMRGITPEDCARMVAENGTERLLVGSDTRLTHRSDALGVPRAAVQMRKFGLSEDDITKVLYDNPKRIFNLR